MKRFFIRTKSRNGFSLLETMISLLILTIVIAVATDAIALMQVRSTSEAGKVDLTQQSRAFIDQIVSDIHQNGFPSIKSFDPADTVMVPSSDCRQDQYIACGLRSVTTNSMQFEGDVDGTGVSEVFIQESPVNGPCPCTIQRGTVSKATYIANPSATPPYYTEVDNVLNTDIFRWYGSDGQDLTGLGSLSSGFGNIANIQITLWVKSSQPDPKTHQYPTVTLVASSKITNINSL